MSGTPDDASGVAASEEIALFPLNTVLFPGGPLELRIFEPRYLDMIRAALKNGREFGVVQIRSGSEVGPAETVDVGTSARIVDFYQLPSGLLGIACRGARRFRLDSRRQQRDGLNLGTVRWLTEPPQAPVPARFERLVRLAEALLAEQGETYAGIEPQLADAAWIGYRLSEILPLSREERQRSLELDGALERLELIETISVRLRERTPSPGA
jgi:Lon protease-like protein